MSSADMRSNDSFRTAKHANNIQVRRTIVDDRVQSPESGKVKGIRGEDDIETAAFEVESQKQQDNGVFIAESFASIANQSLCYENEEGSKRQEGSEFEPQDSILFNAATGPQIIAEQGSPEPIVIEEEDSKNDNSRTNSPLHSQSPSKFESIKTTEFQMIDKLASSVNKKNKQSAQASRRYEFSF